MRQALLITLGIVLVAGCTKRGSAPALPPDNDKSRVTISAGSGSVDYYTNDAKRELVYSISWKGGSATTVDSKRFYYKLTDVSGSLYKDGKVASTFTADSGEADQSAGRLSLMGDVEINSAVSKQKGTLNCEKMSFAEEDRIIKFSGGVHLNGQGFSLGEFDELWSTPDLMVISTPELFGDEARKAALTGVRHNGTSPETALGTPRTVKNGSHE